MYICLEVQYSSIMKRHLLINPRLFFMLLFFCCSLVIVAQDMFNYASIDDHPRLFMRANDFITLEKQIANSPELKTIHDIIITKCNDIYMKSPVLEHKLDESGKRLLHVSRAALEQIFCLAYAYRMTGEKRYLEKAEAQMQTVCDFKDWNPTHYLDVGEMALAVAIGYDWLYADLQPKTKDMVVKAIATHAFGTSDVLKYTGFFRGSNNWNQVCNGGLVSAAIAVFEAMPDRAKYVIERSVKSNELPMKTYAPDGNYPEGYMYWGYGTSFEIILIKALQKAFGSDYGLSQFPGFDKTAEYILYAVGTNGKAFNYSDCRVNLFPKIPMWWFADYFKNPSLLFTELQEIRDGLYAKDFEEARLLPLTMALAAGVDLSSVKAPQKKVWSGNGVAPVVLIRTGWNNPKKDVYVGIKGGRANSGHAHMDAGSFVYDALGLRWAMDFGMEEYAHVEAAGVDMWNNSQNSERWGIFRYGNKSHNTLTLNDARHNAAGFATIEKVIETKNELGAVVDLSKVLENGAQKATRSVILKNEKDLEITDEVIADEGKDVPLRWSMVTPATAKIINSRCIELSQEGKKMYLKVSSSTPFTLKTWPTVGAHDWDTKNPGTEIVGFESLLPAGKSSTFTVRLSTKK